MEFSSRAFRPYVLIDWHHPLVIKNIAGVRGAAQNSLQALLTPEGFDQLRGMMHFVADIAIRTYMKTSPEYRTNDHPIVDMYAPLGSMHCGMMLDVLKSKFKRAQNNLASIDPSVELAGWGLQDLNSLAPGYFGVPDDQRSRSMRFALRAYKGQETLWKTGRRANPPHVPSEHGRIDPLEQLRTVYKGQRAIAAHHAGQVVLLIATSTVVRSTEAILAARNPLCPDVDDSPIPFPYQPVADHGSAHIHIISAQGSRRLTEAPLTISQSAGGPSPENIATTSFYTDLVASALAMQSSRK